MFKNVIEDILTSRLSPSMVKLYLFGRIQKEVQHHDVMDYLQKHLEIFYQLVNDLTGERTSDFHFYPKKILSIGESIARSKLSEKLILPSLTQFENFYSFFNCPYLVRPMPKQLASYKFCNNGEHLLVNDEYTPSIFRWVETSLWEKTKPLKPKQTYKIKDNAVLHHLKNKDKIIMELQNHRFYVDPYPFRHGNGSYTYKNSLLKLDNLSTLTTLLVFDLKPFHLVIDKELKCYLGILEQNKVKILKKIEGVEFKVRMMGTNIDKIRFSLEGTLEEKFDLDVEHQQINFGDSRWRA